MIYHFHIIFTIAYNRFAIYELTLLLQSLRYCTDCFLISLVVQHTRVGQLLKSLHYCEISARFFDSSNFFYNCLFETVASLEIAIVVSTRSTLLEQTIFLKRLSLIMY